MRLPELLPARPLLSKLKESPETLLAAKNNVRISRNLLHDFPHEVGVGIQVCSSYPPSSHSKGCCILYESSWCQFLLWYIERNLNCAYHSGLQKCHQGHVKSVWWEKGLAQHQCQIQMHDDRLMNTVCNWMQKYIMMLLPNTDARITRRLLKWCHPLVGRLMTVRDLILIHGSIELEMIASTVEIM